LNALLARFPSIEQAHHKLWLSSTQVSRSILNSDVYNQTETSISSIKNKIKLYVQTSSFQEGQALLDKHHVCMVSGVPGIGKTMLAEMLLLDLLGKGYQAVKVSGDISAALRLFNPDLQQAFYYDDFLGETRLEDPKPTKSENERLLSFLGDVGRSRNHRFILTTTEHILDEARQRPGPIRHSNIDAYKCSLAAGKYTKTDKARILYNHLYFSEKLGDKEIASVLEQERYRTVISHANYSPRIIEWMTSFATRSESAPGSFGTELLANLKIPNRLWQHVCSYNLSEAAQHLLVTLASLPSGIRSDQLEHAFNSYRQQISQTRGVRVAASDFAGALEELDATMVATRKAPDGVRVTFHNPSIRDFLASHLLQNPSIAQDLLNSATYFEQVETLGLMRSLDSVVEAQAVQLRLSTAEFCGAAGRTFMNKACDSSHHGLFSNSSTEERYARLVKFNHVVGLGKAFSDLELRILGQVARGSDDLSLQTLLALIPHSRRVGATQSTDAMKTSILAEARAELSTLEDFDNFREARRLFPESISDNIFDAARSLFKASFEANAEAELEEASDPSSLKNYVERLEAIDDYFRVDVSVVSKRIEERVAEIEESMGRGHDDRIYAQMRSEGETADAEVDNLFEALRKPLRAP
jgi:hypothetical protein